MQPMKPMEPMQPMKGMEPMKPMAPMKPQQAWWPQALGQPDSSGAQNDFKYAYFEASHKLALAEAGKVEVYDTGSHRINGFGQQQGDQQTLTFDTPNGPVSRNDLKLISEA